MSSYRWPPVPTSGLKSRDRQVGFDREGRLLMYACFAQCQTLKNNPEDVVCHMVYLIEHAKRSIQTSVNTLVFIIDCTVNFTYCTIESLEALDGHVILVWVCLGVCIQNPHTNIMDCLNKTLKQVKIQSFYNGKYIKPNIEELQAYGVDINDNLSEISGRSEEEE
ncbi:unnamed protein product [Schistosoma mattheei]|uniref:CRAL-TRIO domain-containing protein n=1 Tax=Schistosoma mattheei TaxID=31246 RepID=A0AA85BZT2_9TREM|nr:unnamed protein product [Schistosoma mattheei]